MVGFLTFAYKVLLFLGLLLLVYAALAYFGLLNYLVRVGFTFEDRTNAFTEDAFSQSLLLLFCSYVAYRVRAKLRDRDQFHE